MPELSPPPSKLLIVMPTWLGDCVMALPVIAGIKAAFPKCFVGAVFSGKFSELGKMSPCIDETIESSDGAGKAGYDTAILLPNSFRSAWKLRSSGIRRRIGYKGELRSFLLTHSMAKPAKHSIHQTAYYLNLVREFFPSVTAGDVKLSVPPEAMEQSKILLPGGNRPLVGVGFGASYGAAKMWPAERFAKVIDMLGERADVALFGAESDKGVEAAVLSKVKSKPVSLVGKTPLTTLAATMTRLSAYITNDTGPMHLAAALNVPTIAIFGPTSPLETKPSGSSVTIVYRKADCSPCWERECLQDHRCMKAVEAEEVYKAVVMAAGF